ncbi:MAG: hypothetical protein J7500_01215 [Sphingomonas sp.]|nr:hypothetical protein [Sphingomonas sp.]MBO9621307.1 hypothetical protein [Sphingomonas sp.]
MSVRRFSALVVIAALGLGTAACAGGHAYAGVEGGPTALADPGAPRN